MKDPSKTPKSLKLQAELERIRKLEPSKLDEDERKLLDWSQNVDRNYAWVVLALQFLHSMCQGGPYRIYGMIFAKVAEEGIFTREQAAWPITVKFSIQEIACPLVSILIYRYNYRALFSIAVTLIALSNMLASVSRTFVLDVLLLGVLQGVGLSLIALPTYAYVCQYFVKHRNFAYATVLSGATIGVFIWTPLFEVILDKYHWRIGYLSIGIIKLVPILFACFFRSNKRPEMSQEATRQIVGANDQPMLERALRIVKKPQFHMIWFVKFIEVLVFTTYFIVMIDYAVDQGIPRSKASKLLLFTSAGELISRIVLSPVLDAKWITKRVCTILILSSMATLLVLATMTHDFITFALITTALASVVSHLLLALNGLTTDYVGEEDTVLGIGLTACACGTCTLIKPFLIGWFRDGASQSYNPLMYTLAGLCIFGALIWTIEPLFSRPAKQIETQAGSVP